MLVADTESRPLLFGHSHEPSASELITTSTAANKSEAYDPNTRALEQSVVDADSYTFESTNLPREPRAWQRNAAQPYAPRNEAQKIWKRPPLRNILNESNSRWWKGGDGVESSRPVKRLKLRQDLAGKENEDAQQLGYVPTRWDVEGKKLSRKQSMLKIQPDAEACIVGNIGTEEPPPAAVEEDDVNEEMLFDRGQPEDAPLEDKSGNISEDEFDTTQAPSADAATIQNTSDATHSGLESDLTAVSNSIQEQHIAPPLSQDNEQSPQPASATAQLPVTTIDDFFALPTEGIPDAEQPNKAPSLLPSPLPCVTANSIPSAQTDDDDTTFLQQFLQRAKVAREKNQSASLHRPLGDRIQRQLLEQNNNTGSPESKRKRSPESDEVSDSDLEEPTVTSTLHISEIPEEQLSPDRRSARVTRLPRPQRPTALPSNISLRRLNGTEFISMAKQRTEAQNAALLVRNNTRKNKVGAISVRSRLVQLKLGFNDENNPSQTTDLFSSEQQEEPRKRIKRRKLNVSHVTWAAKIARFRDDDGEEYDVLTESEDEDDKMTAKEYMIKIMGPDDETPSPPGSPSSRTRGKSVKSDVPVKSTDSSEKEESVEIAPTSSPKNSAAPSSPKKATPASSTEKKDKSTSKRKRKQAQGSVNGTPAPSKKRIQLFPQDVSKTNFKPGPAALVSVEVPSLTTNKENNHPDVTATATAIPGPVKQEVKSAKSASSVGGSCATGTGTGTGGATGGVLANTKRIRITRSARGEVATS